MGETFPHGAKAKNSLPQGDSFRMIGIACIILLAALDIEVKIPWSVQIIYAQDRTFSCETARERQRGSRTAGKT